MERKFLIFIGLQLISMPSFAGSGFYIGADVLSSNLETVTTTVVDQTNPVSNTTTLGNSNEKFFNVGLRVGHKFKSRLTDRYYWSPEFSLAAFDDSTLYSTNLKLGYEFAPFEIYSSMGVSRIEKFTDNRLNLSLGLEYRLNNYSSVNFEITHYDNINESTNSVSVVGLNTITIDTDTTRMINSIKIGYTYYFKGSK